jgi:hypothetical protein
MRLTPFRPGTRIVSSNGVFLRGFVSLRFRPRWPQPRIGRPPVAPMADRLRWCHLASPLFYEGKCQEKYFSTELTPDQNPWHSAPTGAATPMRVSKLCRGEQRLIADQREMQDLALLSTCWLSLLFESVVRTARSGPGRAVRRGEANPGRRGPF